MRLGLRWTILVLGVVVATSACGSAQPASTGSPAASGASAVTVATSTTVFAEMVQEVGGSLVLATSIVPANGDVHTFAPTPSDVVTVSRARLIVMNGLGLDDWLDKLVTAAAPAGTPLLKLGVALTGVDYIGGDDGAANPHLWMNVAYGEEYAGRIATALAQVDPANAATYAANATAYQARLTTLDGWVRDQIASIPAANRKLVAFHDAFPYYARAYGITIVGVAVEAPGQDPSAAYTAALIDAIKKAGVKVIFSEAQFPPKLVDQLAQATGAKVVANLYDDALGDPPVTSYEAIIRWDTQQLVDALK